MHSMEFRTNSLKHRPPWADLVLALALASTHQRGANTYFGFQNFFFALSIIKSLDTFVNGRCCLMHFKLEKGPHQWSRGYVHG